MDTRIAERRAQIRRERMTRRRRRTVVGLVVLVLLAAAAALERSPLLELASVEVHGSHRLDPAVIREAADLPLGTSTVRLRLRPAEDRVRALPGVRSATLRRTDPLTVRIDVVERLPVIAITSTSHTVLVDADGVVVGRGRPGRLPVVRTALRELPVPGGDVDQLPVLRNAMSVYRGLPGPLRAGVRRYEAVGPDDLDLLLSDGVRVRFGRGDRVAEKARILGALIESAPDGAVIDVRAPANPVVLPAESA